MYARNPIRVNEGRKGWHLVAIKTKAYTVVGMVRDHDYREVEEREKTAKIMEGMGKQKAS